MLSLYKIEGKPSGKVCSLLVEFEEFYSVGFALVSFIVGLIVFNKTEKNFMDTV